MSRKNQIGVVAAVAASAWLAASFASAQILMSDSFDRTNGGPPVPTTGMPAIPDWGTNDNALGGSIVQGTPTPPDMPPGPAHPGYEVSNAFNDQGNNLNGGPWVDGTSGTQGPLATGNIGQLPFGHAEIAYDWATNSMVLSSGSLFVEFDLYEPQTAPQAGHLGWWFGTAEADIEPNNAGIVPLTNTNAEVGLFWRGAGGSGGSRVAGVVVNDFFPIATDLNNLSPNRIRIEVNTTSGTIFSPGATGELKLLIDGVHTDVNGAAAGNDLAFTWDSQGAGYMGFSSNIGIAYGIDNLVISTVPEASSFSAAAFAFCVFVAKFRRRFAR